MTLAVAATLTGARSFAAIGQWAAAATAEQLASFGLDGTTAPDESTLRKLFARIDAGAFDSALAIWMWTRTFVAGQRRVIAVDGKTVRGARHRADDTAAPHLVAAFDHGGGVVLGQVCVETKRGEIPAARTLLARFDLDGAVVTMDALHTQTDTAALITRAGGDYVFTVKANMPTLQRKLKALPWKDIPAVRATATGRGRRITRTIKAAVTPDWIGFPCVAQVAQLRRTITKKGRRTVEAVYLVTSADHLAAPPEVLAAWVQGQWSTESRLHWVRDVTFGEDRSQVHTGQSPRIMAASAISQSACFASQAGTTSLRGYDTMPDIPITQSHWR